MHKLNNLISKTAKQLHPKNNLLDLKVNWIKILILSSFYVYGYFGYGSSEFKEFNFHVRAILILYLITLSIIYLRKNLNFDIFNDRFRITYFDVYLSAIFFTLISIVTWPYLNEYLTQDELSYAGSSLENPLIILKKFDYFPDYFHVNNVLHAVSFALLILNLLAVKIFTKLRFKNQIITIASATILFQLIFGYFGANIIGYSRLNTIPYTISSALFGVGPKVFRFTTILIVSIILSLICKYLINTFKVPKHYWILVSLIFITVPIELTFSLVVDQSIFFFVFSIIPLLEIFFRQKPSPERFIPLLVLGVYFRASIMLVLIIYIYYILKFCDYRFHRLKILFLPLVFLLPYIYALYVSPIASKNTELFTDLLLLPQAIFSSLEISFGIFFILFSIICLFSISFNSKRAFIIVLFYLSLAVIFFYISIPTNLVGTQKYQQEWFSPLLYICLIYSALNLYKIMGTAQKILAILLSVAIVLYNFYSFTLLPKRNSFLQNYPYQYSNYLGEFNENSFALSFHPYPYSKAFTYLYEKRPSYSCLNSGIAYNLLPEIFSGVTIRKFQILGKQRSALLDTQSRVGHDWTSVSVSDLELNNISCVVLGSLTNKTQVIADLLLQGWKIDKVFYHDRFSTNVIIMINTEVYY